MFQKERNNISCEKAHMEHFNVMEQWPSIIKGKVDEDGTKKNNNKTFSNLKSYSKGKADDATTFTGHSAEK